MYHTGETIFMITCKKGFTTIEDYEIPVLSKFKKKLMSLFQLNPFLPRRV